MSNEEFGYLFSHLESNTVINPLVLEAGTKVYFRRRHPNDNSSTEIYLIAYEKVDDSREEIVQIEPPILTTTNVLEFVPTSPRYSPYSPGSPRSPLSLRL